MNEMTHNHGSIIYAAKEPYPDVMGVKKNPHYANLLQENYVGQVSELTAITQYLYHEIIIPNNNDLSEMYHQIAHVEMMHFHLFAEAIIALGGDPVYQSPQKNGQYWTGKFVMNGKNLCDRLHIDLMSEYKAIHTYQKNIEEIDCPKIKALLRRIIIDEEIHAKLFQNAIKKYCGHYDPCKYIK